MRVSCDDDLYRINRTYLGPKGRSWPVHASYRAWLLTFLFSVGLLLGWRLIGLPWHVLVLIGCCGEGFWLARMADRHLTADRPMSAQLVRVWQELFAPRPELDPQPVVYHHRFDIPRWAAGAPPDMRWRARAGAACRTGLVRVRTTFTGRRGGRVYTEGQWRDVG